MNRKAIFIVLIPVILIILLISTCKNNEQEVKENSLKIEQIQTIVSQDNAFEVVRLNINGCHFLLVKERGEYRCFSFLVHDPKCYNCLAMKPLYVNVNEKMTNVDINNILEYNRQLYEKELKARTNVQVRN